MEYLCILLTVLLAAALIKIIIMKIAAKEIAEHLGEKLSMDTNTLVTLSSVDRDMCRLTANLNINLKTLREKQLMYEQGDRQLKEAITNLSHDIRTPLTAINGYLELLKKEEKSKQAEQWLAIISERTDAIRKMTDEMLDYAVAVNEKHELLLEDVVVNDVLEESLSSLYGVIVENNISPEISICEEKIHRILNRNALARIFGNIISNAVKYSDGDLKVSLDENGTISFSNNASELDEISVNKIFQRFYTVENAGKSTGLGLAISKALTEQMNGKINVSYSQNQLFIIIRF